jgi:hypothetical protein
MLIFSTMVSLAGLSAAFLQAAPSGWVLHPADGARRELLTYGSGSPVSYRFECAANEVMVVETGVTKLLDLKSGKQIDDGPDAVMPAGAALMAVFGGKGQPQFQPAEAVKNPGGGWDLTIRLSKEDKQLKAIGKSEIMSLFTTGYTMAVAMSGEDRAMWNGFLDRCRKTS